VTGAKCERWLQFLAETFPPHMVSYLHLLFGYLLTGDTSERKLWIFQGEGDNGKSVLVGLLQSLFLDYAVNVEPVTFTSRRDEGGATPDIARLLGARLAVLHELSDKMQLNLPLIKRATGGTDRMTARHLYGRPFEFRPQFKTLLVTNRYPRINEDDEAVWKRVQVVHFARQIAKENQDPRLLDKLLDEAPGILSWMLEGCLRWQREGLIAPEEVLRETAQYRKSQDLVTLWLEDSEDVVIDKDAVQGASALYDTFRTWAEIEMGIRFVMEQRTFGRALMTKGFERVKRSEGFVYRGLRLRSPNSRF
jgi:putative DNA primase/helicase